MHSSRSLIKVYHRGNWRIIEGYVQQSSVFRTNPLPFLCEQWSNVRHSCCYLLVVSLLKLARLAAVFTKRGIWAAPVVFWGRVRLGCLGFSLESCSGHIYSTQWCQWNLPVWPHLPLHKEQGWQVDVVNTCINFFYFLLGAATDNCFTLKLY